MSKKIFQKQFNAKHFAMRHLELEFFLSLFRSTMERTKSTTECEEDGKKDFKIFSHT